MLVREQGDGFASRAHISISQVYHLTLDKDERMTHLLVLSGNRLKVIEVGQEEAAPLSS